MGDYSGIASFDNRVYGVWTEATAAEQKAPKAAKTSPSEMDGQKKSNAKSNKIEGKDAETGKRHATTIVRVGVADFSGLDGDAP